MTKTIADFPHLVFEWHPTKNGLLEPKDVSFGSHKKIWWKCSVAFDHEWESVAKLRTGRGYNCPYCANLKIGVSNCLATLHPNISHQWHPTRNGTLIPYDIGSGYAKKVWWKCDLNHEHEWEETPNRRVSRGDGCPYCSNHKVCLSNCLATTHPTIAIEWHTTKNILSPYDVVSGSNKQIWWQCNANHEWRATPNDRIGQHQGCPQCSESYGERRISTYLKQQLIVFEREKPIKIGRTKKRFDFYIPSRNMMIEYHGKQHYIPCSFGSKKPDAAINNLRNSLIRDKDKWTWCKKQSINLLIIPFWKIDIIEQVLDTYIQKQEHIIISTPVDVRKYSSLRRELLLK